MTLTVVGSIAFDAVETQTDRRPRLLGGAAVHFALASSFLAETRVIGPVGDDFGEDEYAVLREHSVNVDDIEHVEGGKTFFWAGEYEWNVNIRHTLDTQLNVFGEFEPKLSDGAKQAEMLFLANIQPDLQRDVREQCSAKLAGLDSMNYWIESARESLLKTLSGVDVVMLNDAEVRMLTGEANLKTAAAQLRGHGPRVLVIKQGSYGACMCTDEGFFFVPGMPLDRVVDPTGAGDAFAGGFFGYLDSHADDPFDEAGLRRAAAYGSVMASFAIEDFGSERLERLTHAEVVERCGEFQRLTAFQHLAARERVLAT